MTYRLLYASASPYSCKVRMAAAQAGVSLELIPTETGKQPPVLMQSNPLAKIPVLLLSDGRSIFDSRAIVQYLDRIAGGALFPKTPDDRSRAENLEALADGMCDAMIAHVYERRYRPQEKVHEPWLDKQWSKVTRALAHLETATPESAGPINAGHIALRAALGYLDLRFAGQWDGEVPALRLWATQFDRRFPSLAELLPG